jgi:hypothetical protein
MKKIVTIGGGTTFHIRPHLALSAPAYGHTAREIQHTVKRYWNSEHNDYSTPLYLTRMAGGDKSLDTNEDVSKLVDSLIADKDVKVIFFTVAMCDFEVSFPYSSGKMGKEGQRLFSEDMHALQLNGAPKIINKIRKTRKDIFLVGCKTTTSATIDEMFEAGLTLLKNASCNLVVVNDLHTKMNMIVTPEQAKYCVTTDRNVLIRELVSMTYHRSQLTFTKSEVVEGFTVPWSYNEISAKTSVPKSLYEVVNYCIEKGAYKPFMGKTVGHFAAKVSKNEFITSIRKTNFNELDKVGMVIVESTGKDSVKAFGAKPSVGGMSQRIIFNKFPDLDCIVHFHCQLRPISSVPVRSQREFECGSHECGKNTADGLYEFREGGQSIYAVMLDKHGPNIVFNKDTDPKNVITFIEKHFDLSKQTSELT